LQLTAFWSHFSIRNEQLEVGRLRQKRIILTFSISRFNMQSEKVYYFRTRNSELAKPFLGTDRAFVNHMPVHVFWQW
jgi:hypothetical protein